MNLKRIHNALISGRFTIIIFIILVFVMRLLTRPDLGSIAFWVAFLTQIGISISLLHVNHVYTIVRGRTMLPTVFFLLMSGTSPLFYTEWKGSVIAAGVLVCLICLFASYQKPNSQLNALNIGLILTLCSFVWPPVWFLFPLFWYGFYEFQCLNIKTFFASIIGIITVYLFAFVWAVYNEGIQAFVDLLPHYQDLLVLQSFGLTLQDLLVLSLVAVLFIISGFNIFMSGLSEKIRTGTYLNFLYLISICLAVALVLQSEWKINWTLMIYIPVVFILSHFFTLSIRKITSWTLLFFILFFMGMYVWQVFF